MHAVNTEKGLFRAARSLYELSRFWESQMIFQTLLKAYPRSEAAKKELHGTEDRLREQDHGIYNFVSMYKVAMEKIPPRLDIGTFAGPVTIKMTEGRGRCLFVSRDVTAGEFLLCEKAFSYSFSKNSSTSMLSASMLRGTPGAKNSTSAPSKHFLYFDCDVSPSYWCVQARGDYLTAGGIN